MASDVVHHALICAATAWELTGCPDTFFPGAPYVVSGVGIPATFAGLRDVSAGLIVNIGIAGAYPGTGISIGDIVLADSDVYGDVGMALPDEPEGFLPIAETDFGKEFYGEPFHAILPDFLPRQSTMENGFTVHVGRGCTVNTCTGTDAVGYRRAQQTGAIFETMEGAAVLQIGSMLNVPVCQIRAISNIAANRDMRSENIRLALANLRRYLSGITMI